MKYRLIACGIGGGGGGVAGGEGGGGGGSSVAVLETRDLRKALTLCKR